MARTKQSARVKKQAQKQKQEEKKAADAAKKAGAKAAKPRDPSEDPDMTRDELEIEMEGNLCTVRYTMRKGCDKSIDVPTTCTVKSVMRDLAELNGFKIADAEDAIRIVAEGEERSDPTLHDLEEAWYNADIRDDWETVNYVSVYYKPAPMTASDEKQSELRARLDDALQATPSQAAADSTAREVEEQLWFESGDNGCYCGLTRLGKDGLLVIRADLDDSVDHVMRLLGQGYGFRLASGPDALQSDALPEEGTTLRDVVDSEDDDGVTQEGNVYRLTVTLHLA